MTDVEATEHADVVRAALEWSRARCITGTVEYRRQAVAVDALNKLVLLASRVPQLEAERDEMQAERDDARSALEYVRDEVLDSALIQLEASAARVKELEAELKQARLSAKLSADAGEEYLLGRVKELEEALARGTSRYDGHSQYCARSRQASFLATIDTDRSVTADCDCFRAALGREPA